MGLSREALIAGVDALALIEPRLAAARDQVGYPEPRIRPPGYETLLRTIVGQQVSVAAASSMWRKLEAELGDGCAPDALLARDFDSLRACGLSRQKQGYARSLAELVVSGALDLGQLPGDDEEAIAELVRIKGVGRWSAKSICCLPKDAATSGPPAIWRCRLRWGASWTCPSDRRKRRCETWPTPGDLIAEPRRSLPGIIMRRLAPPSEAIKAI